MAKENPAFHLSPADEAGRWREELLRGAERALSKAESRLGLTLDAAPHIESLSPESEFYTRIGHKPHNLVAVALASENRIIINRDQFLSSTGSERQTTLAHEFAHLILGRRIPGAIPRWLDEGLAMAASDETGFIYHTRLAVAATFGGLMPLDKLWTASSVDSQTLAYAESLSAARFLMETGVAGSGRGSDDPAPLARKLADPEGGRALRSLLFDDHWQSAFERRWRESIRSFWTFLAALTGGGFFWIAVTCMFLLAYWRKQRMARQIEEQWEEEEELIFSEREYDDWEEE